MGVAGPVYVPLWPGQATFRQDSQIFDKIEWSSTNFTSFNENGRIAIFLAIFFNLTNETHLLFSSALIIFFRIYIRLFFQVIFSENISSLVSLLSENIISKKNQRAELKS